MSAALLISLPLNSMLFSCCFLFGQFENYFGQPNEHLPIEQKVVTSQELLMEETAVPSQNHRLTPSHWQFSHMPWWNLNPDSGERQLAVSGNALDHTAIWAGLVYV